MTTVATTSRPASTRRANKPRAPRKPVASKPALPMPSLLLDATPTPDVVTIPARTVLAYEGTGAPESEAFQKGISALYGVAYTLKFARRGGSAGFKIGPLEGRWWAEEFAGDGTPIVFGAAPRDCWHWRLRIAVPTDVTKAELARCIQSATTKKGGKLEHSAEAARVYLERIPAERVGRALHVGPYAEEPRTFQAIAKKVVDAGIEPALSHVEIYLSDPRRTPPWQLETILLRETQTGGSP